MRHTKSLHLRSLAPRLLLLLNLKIHLAALTTAPACRFGGRIRSLRVVW
jgi:hypothetical protein